MWVIMEANLLLGVDLRHLMALETVASNRSFARAAEAAGLHAVGCQPADRCALAGRGGSSARASARAQPGRADRGRRAVAAPRGTDSRITAGGQADLNALAEGTTGSLRIGTFQSIGMSILPTLLSRFRTAWPDIEITLVESVVSSELLEQVERGDLDLTFEALPLKDGPFEVSELLRDPYVLLVPSGSPFARRRARVTLEALAELPLVGYRHPSRTEPEASARTRRQPPLRLPLGRERDRAGPRRVGFAAAIVPRLTVNFDDRADPRSRCRPSDTAAHDCDRLPPRPLPLPAASAFQGHGARRVRRAERPTTASAEQIAVSVGPTVRLAQAIDRHDRGWRCLADTVPEASRSRLQRAQMPFSRATLQDSLTLPRPGTE